VKIRKFPIQLQYTPIHTKGKRLKINRSKPRPIDKEILSNQWRAESYASDYANNIHYPGNCTDATALAWSIKEHSPLVVTPYAFKVFVEASGETIEVMKRERGSFANRERGTGRGVYLELLKDIKHYSKLIASEGMPETVVKWLLHESDSEARTELKEMESRLAAINQREARVEAEQKKGLVKVEGAALTPVVTGDLAIDRLFNNDLADLCERRNLEFVLSQPARESSDYFPTKLILAIAKYLKTKHRKNALGFLRLIAKHDIDRILLASPMLGKDFGLIIGSNRPKAIDLPAVIRTKDKHGFINLFTAWAVEGKSLSLDQVKEIKALEDNLRFEQPITIYQLVNTVINPESNWTSATIMRLFDAALFKKADPAMRAKSIEYVLALDKEERQLFITLMENPGTIRKDYQDMRHHYRFEAIINNFGRLITLPRTNILDRIKLMDKFPFHINDVTYINILSAKSDYQFSYLLAQTISAGDFRLDLSHGLRQQLEGFVDLFGYCLIELARNMRGIRLPDVNKASAILSAAAKLLNISLVGLTADRIRHAFKLTARDTHPDTPLGLEEKFDTASGAREALLSMLHELETGYPLFEQRAIPLGGPTE